jgi:nicotinate-nucleotide--dimethylbenzimidazole phosphoribosyltransferase
MAPVPMILFSSAGDVSRHLATLETPDAAYSAAARDRQAALTKPRGALGRLEDVAAMLAGWSRDGMPRAGRISVVVFAGNHGVTTQGVSPYPPEVTAHMVANYAAGGAAINAICKTFGLRLSVVPLDLDRPTGDITRGPAMSAEDALAALNAGAASVAGDSDVLVLGEMGIGNTTIASALAARALGGNGAAWAGAGTGLDREGVVRKAAVIDRALAHHAAAERTAFDMLRTLGGREIAALCGAIIAARIKRIPVVIDGFVVTAALATLWAEAPRIIEHCIAGHVSAEQAHRTLLAHLQMTPLLDLGMRLGEASGAAVAAAVLRAAVATHNEMATFAEAGVANREGAR